MEFFSVREEIATDLKKLKENEISPNLNKPPRKRTQTFLSRECLHSFAI